MKDLAIWADCEIDKLDSIIKTDMNFKEILLNNEKTLHNQKTNIISRKKNFFLEKNYKTPEKTLNKSISLKNFKGKKQYSTHCNNSSNEVFSTYYQDLNLSQPIKNINLKIIKNTLNEETLKNSCISNKIEKSENINNEGIFDDFQNSKEIINPQILLSKVQIYKTGVSSDRSSETSKQKSRFSLRKAIL